jgi:acetyl-CoA carboxylase biotin carboxyl carrier protein
MPEPHRPSDRTEAEREADHEGLARLTETLVPALVLKLASSGLGELEVREGDWKVRLRRPASTAPRRERTRPGGHGPERRELPIRPVAPAHPAEAPSPVADSRRALATSPAVGVFRTVASVGARVRSGDRIAVVDLLGIPQDVVAPIDGILAEVFVETGQVVEYGEELAAVEDPAEDPPEADAAGADATHPEGRA